VLPGIICLHFDNEIVAKSRKRIISHFTRQRISATSQPFLSTVQDDNGVDLKLEETCSRKTMLEHILIQAPTSHVHRVNRALPPVSCLVLREDSPSSHDRNVNYDPKTTILWPMQQEELP
jgi:hypothetical protein